MDPEYNAGGSFTFHGKKVDVCTIPNPPENRGEGGLSIHGTFGFGKGVNEK